MEEIEEWRDWEIEGVKIRVSNLGRVWTYPRKIRTCGNKTGKVVFRNEPGKERVFVTNSRGYASTKFTKKGKTILHHRLVATVWIENPKNKPEVNHKNGIKNDNRVCNLEWATSKENKIHAITELGFKPCSTLERAVVNLSTGEWFCSGNAAGRAYGHKNSTKLSNHLRGLCKSRIWGDWAYADEVNPEDFYV